MSRTAVWRAAKSDEGPVARAMPTSTGKSRRAEGVNAGGHGNSKTEERDPSVRLREIMSRVNGAEIIRRHGAKFYFRFYLTNAMAEAGIESLELGVRSYNCLKRAGFSTIGQLAEAVAGEEDVLSRIRNCGRRSAEEIKVCLFAYQYESLRPERREAYFLETVALNAMRRSEPDQNRK